MGQNYYSEINLHIVWHTKDSLPLLSPNVEVLIHRELRQRIVNWPGAFIHEINGTENHVHLVVSLAPTIQASDLIGKLKGGSAHTVNQRLGHKAVQWQSGYGIVSFGAKDLPWVCDYVRKQKEHHRTNAVFDRLERVEPNVEGAVAAQADGQAVSPVNGTEQKNVVEPFPP